MSLEDSSPDPRAKRAITRVDVTLPCWVNERFPAWAELLSTHDVARLTRRPRWLLASLMLVGRFPRKCRYRGRDIGWLRSEVLDWLSRERSPSSASKAHHHTTRGYARASSQQPCLPFECAISCRRPERPCSNHRKAREMP